MSSESSDGLRLLSWDTEHWGRPTFALTPRDELHLAELHERLSLVPGAIGFLDVPAHRLDLVRAGEQRGFQLMDVRVTFARHITADDALAGHLLRSATLADVDELAKLAGAVYRFSRFREDSRFDRNDVDRMYASWVRNTACSPGGDSVVLVDHRSDGPSGFVTCVHSSDESVTVGLIAVAPAAAGQGVGGRLLNAACGWGAAVGATQLIIGTSSTNLEAQHFYQRQHCRLISLNAVLHWWHPLPPSYESPESVRLS